MLVPLLPDGVKVPVEYKSIKCFPLGNQITNLRDYAEGARDILMKKQKLEQSIFCDSITWKANGSLNKHLHSARENFMTKICGVNNLKKIEAALTKPVEPVCNGVAILSGPNSKKYAFVAEKLVS